MLRIQPQCIIVESVDRYLVRFDGKNGVSVEYTFSLTWTGEAGVLNSDQREFYFATYDDPATKLLLKAIDSLDSARRIQSRRTASTVGMSETEIEHTGIFEPISLAVESENSYRVRLKTKAGEKEYLFKIHEEGFQSVECEPSFSKMTNDDPAVPLLTKAIACFHQARHFEYPDGSGNKTAETRIPQTEK
jgi:hypothetical protein